MSTAALESPVTAGAPGTNRWYLSAAPIARALVHLCVPMAAAMIVGAVYNLINAGFIGSLHDPALLAAITFGAPLLGLVMAVGGVFGVGGSALISRLLGAAENEPAKAGEIKHVASFAVWGSVIVGAVFGGLGLFLMHPLVSLLGADAAATSCCSSWCCTGEWPARRSRWACPTSASSPTSSSGCSGTASTYASRRAGSRSPPPCSSRSSASASASCSSRPS